MPADRPRFHERAESIDCDELMFDLEDSVGPDNKATARLILTESLERLQFVGKTVAVRINGIGTPWFEDDIGVALRCSRVDCLVVPKVGSAQEIRLLEAMLISLGRHVGLETQIETASGLEHAFEIADSSKLIEALHFGPFDLAASLGTPINGPEIHESIYLYGLIRMLVAARAAGCQAVDGPVANVRDTDSLQRSANRAAEVGCDGKWAIHPDQVPLINMSFTPGPQQVDRARAIVKAYERALADGLGAVTLDGEMLDEAIRRWAEATLARATAQSRTD